MAHMHPGSCVVCCRAVCRCRCGRVAMCMVRSIYNLSTIAASTSIARMPARACDALKRTTGARAWLFKSRCTWHAIPLQPPSELGSPAHHLTLSAEQHFCHPSRGRTARQLHQRMVYRMMGLCGTAILRLTRQNGAGGEYSLSEHSLRGLCEARAQPSRRWINAHDPQPAHTP